MFARLVVSSVALLLAGAPLARALDFQLNSSVVEEDGFKHEQPFFRNDDKTNVFVTLPPAWDRTAEPGSLTLTAPGETDSMVRVEKSPFAPDLPFKDPSLDTYRHRVLGTIPQGRDRDAGRGGTRRAAAHFPLEEPRVRRGLRVFRAGVSPQHGVRGFECARADHGHRRRAEGGL